MQFFLIFLTLMHIKFDKPIVLFLFAHQDDEFGVFQRISMALTAGRRVCCAYFTTGMPSGKSSLIRDEESIKILRELGVAREDISFVGSSLSISDGRLVHNLTLVTDWITRWLSDFDQIESIYFPAWEGGHPDHDALHAAVIIATSDLPTLIELRQFPLYNGYKCAHQLFRVFKPLPANGIVYSISIPWSNRLRFLRYCLSYTSQRKSWLGLFPFVLLHYFFFGNESVQGVSLSRVIERPHDGPLYYERRCFCTWSEVSYAVNVCLQRKTAIETK
jgi:GlcNAc-PI de-N-acetylase